MRRRTFLRAAGTAGALGAASATPVAADPAPSGDHADCPAGQAPRDPPREYGDYAVRAVPGDYATVQAAVDAAEPRDLVLVDEGVYREAVTVETPRLTIRGRDRNQVHLFGEFERENGVHALADDVVVENLTVRGYTENGVYWTGTEGFRASYVTVANNRMYGLYTHSSVHGRFDHCYASGHADSGFYIGESNPSHAIITDCVAAHNAIGYSGTNAGGCLTLKDSVWRHNKAGIVPNSLVVSGSEAHPHGHSPALAPQSAMRIEDNEVWGNNNADAPARDFGDMAFGTGILVAGGTANEIVGNDVHQHVNFGIGLVMNLHKGEVFLPRGNHVRDNRVRGSARADLALGWPNDGGNRFEANDAGSSRPAGLDGGSLSGAGDPWVTMVLFQQFVKTLFDDYPRGDWTTAPGPDGPRPQLPEPDRPPREAVRREAG